VSKEWKLLLFGERTFGEVISQKVKYFKTQGGASVLGYYSVIKYKVNNEVYTIIGQENIKYPIGRKLKILYSVSDNSDCIILNFREIYLGKNMILPAILLLIWITFNWAFKETYKKRGQNTIR